MYRPRYQSATVSFPGEGQVWMLGGRDGSNILQDSEVLQYPADWNKPSKTFVLKRWEWAHKKMKAIEVWHKAVVGFPDPSRGELGDPTNPGIKQLPMPLAGHCVVKVSGGVLVIGGGTNIRNEDGTFQTNSGPIPTSHIHFYHKSGGNANKWSSSLVSALVKGTKTMSEMKVARMNHACLTIGNSIYVAGGLTRDNFNQSLVTRKVERYDFSSNTWSFEANLPNLMTGFQMIKVNNRPALVGRYGAEQQQLILRYSTDRIWETLSAKLLLGRSDYTLASLPLAVNVFPDLTSANTKFNPGSGGSADWRKVWGKVVRGVRQPWSTNAAARPWLQLDLGAEVMVRKVRVAARQPGSNHPP